MKKLLLSLVVLAVALVCGTREARAYPSDLVSATALPITGDSGAAGAWSEILVTLEPRAEIRGTIVVVDLGWADTERRIVETRPITLTPSQTTKVNIPALAGRKYEVRLHDASGTALWYQPVSLQSGRRAAMFAMNIDPPKLTSRDYEEGTSHLYALPQSTWTYDGVSLFFIDSTTTTTIPAAACGPLTEWLQAGGTLVIVRDDVPATNTVVNAACGLGNLELGTRDFGRGRIVGLNPRDLTPTEVDALQRSTVGRRYVRPAPGELGVAPETNHAPRAALALVFIAVFGVIAGPVLFFRVRKRKKTHFVPILGGASLASFAVMLLLGRAFAERAHVTTTVVRELTSGDQTGRKVQTRVFYAPNGVVRTTRSLPGSLLGEEGQRSRSAFRLEGETIVLNERRPAVDDYVFVVESVIDRIDAPINIRCTREKCALEVPSSVNLERSRLYVPARGFFDVGAISGSRTIRLDVPAMNGSWSSQQLDERYALQTAKVALVGWQAGAPVPTMIGVVCNVGCEDAK